LVQSIAISGLEGHWFEFDVLIVKSLTFATIMKIESTTMQPNFSVLAVQMDILWEQSEANRSAIADVLHRSSEADLIVLPEMFTTGFSMNPETIAEPWGESGGVTLQWMQQLAAHHRAAVTGSVAIEQGGLFYNRLLWVEPSGHYYTYDKNHLFTMAGEDRHYTPGNDRLIVEWKGWRICPLVCYDLRFPEWSRNAWLNHENRASYDLALYVANWPAVRSHPWSALLTARAIENQAFVIGVNRVGTDGEQLTYSGNSAVLDAKGVILRASEPWRPQLIHASLQADDLLEFRNNFPVLKDQRG
jgi:omega-amidase